MRPTARFRVLLPALVAGVAACAQSTFYVTGPAGNDANTGLSLSTGWATIQHAFDAATPASTVLIKGGTYAEHPVLNVSGQPGAPITFREFPGEQVVISGNPALGSIIITVEDKQHIRLHGLLVQGLITPDAIGILLRSTAAGPLHDVQINRCTVRNIGWTTDPAAIPSATDNAQAIVCYGEHPSADSPLAFVTLDSLEVYGNITGFSEAISFDGNCSDCKVSHCSVYNNTNIGIDFGGNYGVCPNPLADKVRNSTISDCRCWNNVSPYATSGGIYLDGVDNNTVTRNICQGNGFGIEVGCEQNGTAANNRITDNLMHANMGAGLAIGGYDAGTTGQVLNTLVRNNSFHHNDAEGGGTGELLISKATGTLFRNNLFMVSAQGVLLTREAIAPQADNTANHDLWWTPGADPAAATANWGAQTLLGWDAFRNASGWEAEGLFSNPLVENPVLPDLHLTAQSPCINAGDPAFPIPANELDLDGLPRVSGTRVDIGAYEFQGWTGLARHTEEQVAIGPVPCHDVLLIQCNCSVQHATVLDPLGRIVLESAITDNRINVETLAPGCHVLLLATDHGLRRLHFIHE